MKRYRVCLLVVFCLSLVQLTFAQTSTETASALPRLVRFGGTAKDLNGSPLTGVAGITFALYSEQTGGAPLWEETQNITVDNNGHYSALLGSTITEGLPAALFTSEQAHWVGVQVQGQPAQPRVLLVSVPYALKASDADTLGGRPASAYLVAGSLLPSVGAGEAATPATSGTVAARAVPNVATGTENYVAKFTDATNDLGNSDIFDVNGQVSVGGIAALAALTLIGNVPGGAASGLALYNEGGLAGASISLDFYNTSFNAGIPQARIKALDDGDYSDHLTFWTKNQGAEGNPLTERARITSTGSVGIGTTTPAALLEVNGTAQVDGNLTMKGLITFGPGQTFPVNASDPGGSVVVGNNTSTAPTSGTNGGWFSSSSPASSGVVGIDTAGSTGTGVYGQGSGNGVIGSSTATSGSTAGGSFSASSPAGSGVVGVDTAGTTGIGVFGQGSGYGVYSQGNANVTGNLTVAGSVNGLTIESPGTHNTGLGLNTLASATTGLENTAVGYGTLSNNTTGEYNVAIGGNALHANTGGGSGEGNSNTAIGDGAMLLNSTGGSNLALGSLALGTNTVGSNNIAVGNTAGNNISGSNPEACSNNIDIGNTGTIGDSGVIRIGSGAQTSAYIAGINGVKTSVADAVPVLIDNTGNLGTINSSRRYKEDIQDMGDTSSGLLRLRPVTFRYKQPYSDGSKPIQYGLIAEEVAEVYPELVARGADGQIQTVKYQVLDSMLLNELQKQNATIAAQQEHIQSLEDRLARVEAALAEHSSH
jgi:hypothetical protein